MQETLQLVDMAISNGEQIHHVVVNAGKIVAMQKDLQLRQSVNESDLINADGQAIVWAANLLGQKLPERVSGIDLMEELVKRSFEKGYKCYFFGPGARRLVKPKKYKWFWGALGAKSHFRPQSHLFAKIGRGGC